jgi:hypothetical protein
MQDLKSLLDLLLSEDRAQQLKTDQERVRGYLKTVNKLIKEQQGIQSQTGRGGQLDRLSDRQGEIAERTGKLHQQMRDEEAEAQGKSGEKPSDSPEDQPGDEKSPDGKSSGGKSSDGKSADGKSSEEKSGEGDQGKKSDQGEPGEGGTEKKDGEKKDSGKDGDEKSDKDADKSESKSDEAKPGEQPDQKPSGDPSSGKPGEPGQPQEGQPQQGQPQQGQPQQGGQPGEGGEPSESKPGQQPPSQESDAQQRVQAAQQRMQDAKEKLEKALREEAVEKQEEALRELEAAKAELEKILRQMREEEMARILALLEARFRKMLAMQVEVYEGTIRLDRLPQESRGRGSEIESGRLSQTEALIATEADKALTLLKEEGSAVAMPEALEQTRDDMHEVTRKLADFDVGAITQGLEEDIIAGLEEMIAALQKAQEELEAQQGQQQPPPPGEPQEPPLVDQLAELRMIRSLQMRVNRRTQTYSKLIEGEQADKPELLEALTELAQRQNRIYRTTRDIVVGKNE